MCRCTADLVVRIQVARQICLLKSVWKWLESFLLNSEFLSGSASPTSLSQEEGSFSRPEFHKTFPKVCFIPQGFRNEFFVPILNLIVIGHNPKDIAGCFKNPSRNCHRDLWSLRQNGVPR